MSVKIAGLMTMKIDTQGSLRKSDFPATFYLRQPLALGNGFVEQCAGRTNCR